MNLKEWVKKGVETEKEMGYGKKMKDIPEFLGNGTPNPYYIFKAITSKGIPEELIEIIPNWTAWHQVWYFTFKQRHKYSSGQTDKRKKTEEERFFHSRAGQEIKQGFERLAKENNWK